MTVKKISMPALALIVSFILFRCFKVSAADRGEAVMADAQAAVIQVQSGFLDRNGIFQKIKSGSGFLIANKEGSTYIITNYYNVSNTQRAINKYCKKHAISTKDTQFSNYIQIVIKGDVTAEAEVVVKSAEKDYCVLSAADVVSQKETLKLGSGGELEINDSVYAYGFPQKTGINAEEMEYSENEVRAVQGLITQIQSQQEDDGYLVHSAPVDQGYAGGPLLDADGYVIGISCRQTQEEDTGTAYALPIEEISTVLDNFSIYYGSRKIDEAFQRLEEACSLCRDLYASGGYKKASMEALQQALASAEEMMKTEEPAAEQLMETEQMLAAAKEGLVPKMKLPAVMIRVFGVCDGILFIFVLVLVLKNEKEKRQGTKREAPRQKKREDKSERKDKQPEHRQTDREGMSLVKNIWMVRKKTGQEIFIGTDRFIIGKSRKQTDFSIPDNQTVSRRHAVIFENNGSWYIDDLESLNGTYVNGRKLTPGQAEILKNGYEIALSDEVFFVMEK